MAEVKDLFSSKNEVGEISEGTQKQTFNHIETIKAFARATYKSIYVIDYQKKVLNMSLIIHCSYAGTVQKKLKKWDILFTSSM